MLQIFLVDIMEMEIMLDHVHILMEADPQFGIHKAVKSMKGYTSRILRRGIPVLKNKDAYPMDKQLFCIDCWWCSSGSHQAVY